MAALTNEDLLGRLRQLELENARMKAECEISLLEQQLSNATLGSCRQRVIDVDNPFSFSSTPRLGIVKDRLGKLDLNSASKKDASLRQTGTSCPIVEAATFDGSTSWLDYKAHFDTCADINGWNSLEKGQFLAVSLRGQAQGVLGNLSTSASDYDALVEALEDRFAPPNQTELHRVQLKERRQRASESLSELGQDIRRLTNLAYPSAPHDIKEVLAKEQFVDSLKSMDMRLRVKQARPTNLNDAIRYAVDLEAFNRAEKAKLESQGIIGSTSTVSSDKSESIESNSSLMKRLLDAVGKLESQVKELQNKRRINTGGRSSRRSACYECGARNHLRDTCPKLLRDQDSSKSSSEEVYAANSVRSGLFIPITCNGLTLDCLVDTGSTITVMSSRIWDACKEKSIGGLQPFHRALVVASGAVLNVKGKASVKLRVDGQTYKADVIVADIENDLMMGLDFMTVHKCSLDVSTKTLRIEGKCVKLTCQGKIGCFRIVEANDAIVSPRCNKLFRIKDSGGYAHTKGLRVVHSGNDKVQAVGSVHVGQSILKKGACHMLKECCDICARTFTTKNSLLQHIRRKHDKDSKVVTDKMDYQDLHGNREGQPDLEPPLKSEAGQNDYLELGDCSKPACSLPMPASKNLEVRVSQKRWSKSATISRNVKADNKRPRKSSGSIRKADQTEALEMMRPGSDKHFPGEQSVLGSGSQGVQIKGTSTSWGSGYRANMLVEDVNRGILHSSVTSSLSRAVPVLCLRDFLGEGTVDTNSTTEKIGVKWRSQVWLQICLLWREFCLGQTFKAVSDMVRTIMYIYGINSSFMLCFDDQLW